jgi:hypothetical protein
MKQTLEKELSNIQLIMEELHPDPFVLEKTTEQLKLQYREK